MFYKTSDTRYAQYKTPSLENNEKSHLNILMQQSVHLDSLNVSCNENSARQNHFEQCMLQSGQFFTKLLLQCIQEGVKRLQFLDRISWIIAKDCPFFSSLDFPTIKFKYFALFELF